ncbi:prevent-host-death protein [Chamaesiphon sp.]|uniref:prevent-host-death protein n=1 Tax=Chamaesiphon sp. TaxID=2814140 RepID=UPI0035942E42
MRRFSVTAIQNTDSQALHQAESEPVLLTAESQSSYVIMSVENYDRLIDRLERLEDIALGQQAQTDLSTSRMVGMEIFTAELQRLAVMDADG